jgi:hypothetical protein
MRMSGKDLVNRVVKQVFLRLRQLHYFSHRVVSTLESVCLSMKTTLRLSYRVLERHFECPFECDLTKAQVSFPTLDKITSVVFTLKQTLLSVEMTIAEALFLRHNKCRNDTPVFTVNLRQKSRL